MISLLFSFILSIVTPSTLNSPETTLKFRHIDTMESLSFAAINGLYQDEFGRLWVGTKNGVNCYDGFRATKTSLQTPNYMVMSNLVPTICGNENGKLYVNTDYQVLEYDFKTGRSQSVFVQENTSSPPAIAISWNDRLWIGHYNDIFAYSDGDTHLFASLPIQEAKITVIKKTESGKIIVGTQNNGVWLIKEGSVKSILNTGSAIISLFEDEDHNMWCSTLDEGVYMFNSDGKLTMHIKEQLSSPYVRAVGQDVYGNIWLGTAKGLDVVSNDYSVHSYGIKDGLSDTSIWIIMRDASGKMWLGTYFGGMDVCDYSPEYCTNYDFPSLQKGKQPQIRCIMDSGKGGLLLGSEGNALLRLDKKKKQLNPMPDCPLKGYNIKSMTYDEGEDLIWISTHMGGLWSYDSRGRYKHYEINPNEKSTRSESLTNLAIYGDTLIIGTISGVYMMDKPSGIVSPVKSVNEHIFEADRIIVSRDKKNIWICGNRIIRYDITTDTVEDIIGDDNITANSIIEDHLGRILIGTNGYGLISYDPMEKTAKSYNKSSCGLDCKNIGAILELENGQLIIGSEKGPYLIDCNRFKSYALNDFLDYDCFPTYPGDIHLDKESDEVYFAGPKGLASLRRDALEPHGIQPALFISSISVKGVQIKPDDGSGILSKSILYTDKIVLPYSRNSIDIVLGTSDPGTKIKSQYAFRMDSSDATWTTQDSESPIHLSNLSAGRYTLQIKPDTISSNDDNARTTTLRIVIRPPFYASAVAFIFYSVIIALVVILSATGYRKRINKRNEEVGNRQKMKFIGNISHELRTPLTLIISQLELQAENSKLNAQEHEAIASILQEAWDMKDLINDQLDALKYGRNELPLDCSQNEIVSFVQAICDRFSADAKSKGIELTFGTEIKKLMVLFDPSLFRKVLYNLLSNAFKYSINTPAQVSVTVKKPENGMIEISVSDNGIGIQENMKDRIFERFIQDDNAVNQDYSVTGTGIGLYLVREIVEAHHGKVSVESTVGVGSKFSVYLPVSEVVVDSVPSENDIMMDIVEDESEENRINGSILIVEDDDSLRSVLLKVFESTFTMIYEARNGREGLEIAIRYSPDIIISDIMMPVMTGVEMCKMVKENFETCHIPVVLLTALSGVDNNVSGIKCGADDYITKPFSAKLLLAKCVGICNNRRLMQKRFYTEDTSTQLPTTNLTDRDFLNKLISIIEENILDDNITVSYICDKLNMSHTKLFNKVKGITGQAPQEFLTSIKFKVAAKMLRENRQASISEISYALGFSSVNYFGKCFKERFGKTPSEYRNSSM